MRVTDRVEQSATHTHARSRPFEAVYSSLPPARLALFTEPRLQQASSWAVAGSLACEGFVHVPCRFTGAAPLGAGAGGFAFGAGLTSTVSAAAGKAAATSDAPLSADLDGEIAQCLRHLSKKDATTKLKALQVGESVMK